MIKNDTDKTMFVDPTDLGQTVRVEVIGDLPRGSMPDKPDNGGPAFPFDYPSSCHTGMSLRDYFAGQAVVGVLAGRDTAPTSEKHIEAAARWSYQLADAMLKARAR